jgi:hypothetical protein
MILGFLLVLCLLVDHREMKNRNRLRLSHGNRLVMIMFSHSLLVERGNFWNGILRRRRGFFDSTNSISVIRLISEKHGRRYSFFNTLKDLLINANRQHFPAEKCRCLISHNEVLVMDVNGLS